MLENPLPTNNRKVGLPNRVVERIFDMNFAAKYCKSTAVTIWVSLEKTRSLRTTIVLGVQGFVHVCSRASARIYVERENTIFDRFVSLRPEVAYGCFCGFAGFESLRDRGKILTGLNNIRANKHFTSA
jgi:hypothetical protein